MADRNIEVSITAKDQASRSIEAFAKSFDHLAARVAALKLPERLNSPSQLAMASLEQLTRAVNAGEMELGEYEDATVRVQRAFQMVTPESERAAREMARLTQALAKGDITADQYAAELKQLATTLDQVEKESKQAGAGLQSVMTGVGQSVGMFATNAVASIPRAGMELFKLGLTAEATEHRFLSFAGSTEFADELLAAFTKGTSGAVDKLGAMTGAAKMLQMGLVDNAAEMETMAGIAVKLGNQTVGASDRLADFSMLLANRSIPRLDNFGVSSGKVRKRLAELKEEGYGLDEAFKLAVLEQGTIALEKLGDVSDQTTVKVDILMSSIQDAKVGFGTLAVEAVAGAKGIDEVSSRIRNMPTALEQMVTLLGASGRFIQDLVGPYDTAAEAVEHFQNTLKRSAMAHLEVRTTSEELRYSHIRERYSLEDLDVAYGSSLDRMEAYNSAQEEVVYITGNSSIAFDEYQAAIDDADSQVEQFITTERKLKTELLASQALQLELATGFTSQFQSMEESAKMFAEKRETLEGKHAEKMDELQRRGTARAVRLNVGAEDEKLTKMRRSLEIALVEQAAYTERTSQASQMRKEDQIAKLTGEIDAQEKLLADYHAGRLIRAGENVSLLMAEETKLHEQKLAALDTEMQREKEAQKSALDQMVLGAFDAWSDQKDIPPKKMQEMRVGLAEEMGLVEKGSADIVADMISEWEDWATDVNVSTDDVVRYMGEVIATTDTLEKELLALTATEYALKVRFELLSPDWPDPPGPGLHKGTDFFAGGAAIVGEAGPELVYLPRGSRVVPNSQIGAETRGVAGAPLLDSHDTINVYTGGAAATMAEERRRERRQVFRRAM